MLHIFDIDSTVIRKNSAWYFLREALSTGDVRFSQIRNLPFEWIRYKLGKPNMGFIEEAVSRFAGMEKSALERIAGTCFERRIKPNIFAEASRLITEALNRGEKVIFATSSLDIIIRPLECFFGVTESIASVLEFRDSITTGRLAGDSCFGQKKKTTVEKWVVKNGYNAASVCFYSDSYVDIPLLEFCGKAVAVNPDRILAKEAKKRGWEIVRFKELLSCNI